VINKKYLISLKIKEIDEEILIAVTQMNRVMALLDQNLIRNTDSDAVVPKVRKIHPTVKLLLFVFFISITTFILQYFGLFQVPLGWLSFLDPTF
jgi:hypothetical protein